MSNFFKDILNGVNNVQQDYLGPNYLYYEKINSPTAMGMSSDGTLDALAKNVSGLVGYTQLLVSGGGPASKVPGPLGNKFFLKTGAKCRDVNTGKDVDRYIYVDNVPSGNIPFISSLLNENFDEFRGLVPGIIEDIGKVNPLGMFQAFMMGNKPDCSPITLEVVDSNNNVSQQTHFLANVDINNMNSNKQGFQNMFPDMFPNTRQISSNIPDDYISKLFFAGFGGLLLYILYLIVQRTNKLNNK
jgi:hypothetical protein